ncbi:MAG: hypothetical protein OEM52_05920 [bacterium]|nr:hypothetical protein [bacterium]
MYRLMFILLTKVVLTVSFVYSSFAQDSLNIRKIGETQVSGEIQSLYVSNDTIFAADQTYGLRVFNSANLPSITQICSLATAGDPLSVVVRGDFAFFCDGYSGLRIFDVSNPIQPVQVGHYDTPGRVANVLLVGNHAFISDWSAGIKILDISDPTIPRLVGSCETHDAAYSIAIQDGYAYVANHLDGLRIIDISQLSNPIDVGHWATPGFAVNVAVSGNYAFVADSDSGLQVLNISNPITPLKINSFYIPGGQVRQAYIYGDYLLLAFGSQGLRVLDISDPYSISEVGFYNTPGWSCGIFVNGTTVYNSDATAGFQILDISSCIQSIEVMYPDSIVNLLNIGCIDTLRWIQNRIVGSISIELNRNYPSGTWETLFANTANDGSEPWIVTGPATNHARIRISAVSDTSIYDVSDNDFGIQTLHPPANLYINAATANSLQLAWNDTISGESGFAVYRSDDGINFHLIGTTLPDCTRYLDVPLQPNHQYWYRVYSKYQNIFSDFYVSSSGSTPTAIRNEPFQQVVSSSISFASVKQTQDQGFVTTGSILIEGRKDLLLQKFNPNGTQSWYRNFGLSTTEHEQGFDVVQTYDEGYACFGENGVYDLSASFADGWLVRTTNIGDLVFERAVSLPRRESLNSGVQNPNGGYITCGSTSSIGADLRHSWEVFHDNSGNAYDWRTFGGDFSDKLVRMKLDYLNNVLMIGVSVVSTSSSSVSIVKTDILGNAIWSRLYGLSGWNNGMDLTTTTDGGFAAVGMCNGNDNGTTGDVWLLRCDANGDTLWTRTFGGANYDYANSICLFGDIGYAVTGVNKSIVPGSPSLWTIITDLNGNLLWEQAITDGSATVGNSIIQAADGDLVVAGEGNNGAYLAKIRPISLTLQSLNSGGFHQVGVSDTIRWSLTGINSALRIQLNRNYPTGTWETLFDSAANDGEEPWRITGPNTEHARIRIYPLLFPQEIAESDADFTIYTPIIRPNGGETFIIDEPDTIRWNFPTLTSGIATIKINRGYPNALWQLVASSVPITQGYRAWTPTGSLTNTARIAIIPAGANAYLADTSDANFSILPRFIQVTRPNGGELILTGLPDTIRWNAPYPGTLAIYLSRLGQDYGQLELITDSVYAPTGQYVWTPTGPISDSCYIYIGDVLNPVEDWSDNRFRIVNSTITITKPNDGEVFYFGLPDTVKWSSVNLTGNVAIDLRRTVTGDWTNLFPGRPNTGQTIWWPAGTSTISAKVRVRSLLEPGTSDTSDFAFSIQNYPWSTLLRYLARNPQALSNPNAAWAPPIPYDIASNNYPPLEVAFPEQVVGHANPDSVVTSYTAIANDELSISRSINRIWSVAPSNQLFENATLTLRFVLTDLPPTIADPTIANPPLRAVFSEDDESTWIFIPGGTVYRDTVNNNSFRFVITGLNHMSEWALTNGGLRPALTSPNGGETLTIGDTVTFRWSNAIRGGTVSIAINRTYPSGEWETILSNTPNDSLEQWLVSGDVTNNARFRIVSEWFASDGDTTNAAVTIQSAANPPRAPANVTITPDGNHMQLQWSRVDSSTANLPITVTGYRIDYRDDVLQVWSPLSTVEPMTTPSYIDSNAVIQTSQRYYQIHALLNTTDAVSTGVDTVRPHSSKPLLIPEGASK